MMCVDAAVVDLHTYRVYDTHIWRHMASSPPHEDISLNRRINVSLPEETVELLDRVAPKGDRSRFIDEAVRYYIDERGRAALKKRLKEGATRRAARDLSLAEEWFSIEEEAWPSDRA
jgi:CopG family transcriptional regulator/antitoxin EndoAI